MEFKNREHEVEATFEGIMTKNFPKLMEKGGRDRKVIQGQWNNLNAFDLKESKKEIEKKTKVK